MMKSPDWKPFRDDLQGRILTRFVDQFDRMSWSAELIKSAQRDGLRTLLRRAAEHSPFHRLRLADTDIERVEPDDLSALPVMTKAQMMDSLDDVFTDRRLRRATVESTLAGTDDEPVPILDEYIALASGGCSGRRGIFVLDRAAASAFMLSVCRQPGPVNPIGTAPGVQPLMALVASPSAVHATGMLAALTCAGAAPVRSQLVPATLPVGEIVDRPRPSDGARSGTQ
jgi:hypothetical protein